MDLPLTDLSPTQHGGQAAWDPRNFAMVSAGSPGRRLLPVMRVLLVAGTVLVLAAGTQLYVLSAHTDRYFARTIANPLKTSG
jgi:hypothetical protein